MPKGLLGRKIGMTKFNHGENGRIPVTLLEVGPCVVLQKKTVERDGYAALKLGFGTAKASRQAKAQRAVFEKLKTTPRRFVREFRVTSEELGEFEEGQEIKVEQLFTAGQFVDVAGRSKGRGFAGVMKRWGMAGNSRTHGTHETFRGGGSIGNNTWPGWVQKNKKMPGHLGDRRVTTQNLQVVEILPEKNCVLVHGAVPGSINSMIEIRPAAKRTAVNPSS